MQQHLTYSHFEENNIFVNNAKKANPLQESAKQEASANIYYILTVYKNYISKGCTQNSIWATG